MTGRGRQKKNFFMSNTSYKGRHRSRFGRISSVTSLYLGHTGRKGDMDHEVDFGDSVLPCFALVIA